MRSQPPTIIRSVTTMPTTIQNKLAAIIAEIERTGSADTQRLTVLKKWFETEGRLQAFAHWIMERITTQQATSSSEAAALLEQARAILETANSGGSMDEPAMRSLLGQCRDFQSEIKRVRGYPVRLIHDHSVLLLELALAISLRQANRPADGYQLAARYCEHYDARYGNTLNGPAKERLQAIAAFIAAETG
jgi:hypothetical protein